MKVCLLALPWHDDRLPQPAIGSLAAYLRKLEPAWEITTEYAYVDVAEQDETLYRAISASSFEGERLYAALMYQRGVDELVAHWDAMPTGSALGDHLHDLKQHGTNARAVIERVLGMLDRHLDDLVASRDWRHTVVGLTTSFSQLFANLLLARRLEASGAGPVIVLGGATVSPAAIADSIVASYRWIDYVIRGEGELPFHALLQHLERPDAVARPRVVVTHDQPATTIWQVPDLDVLPAPDYDAFFARIRPGQARTYLPIEGSRGCWWDRTTKNPRSTCQFCNLNVQWDGYRQRSARNVAAIMGELAARHRSTQFAFLDNIIRVRGFDDLIDEIAALGFDTRIFHEARANLRPRDLLRLYEVGLRSVQFGIEALSTSLLQRINKGTTVIMNLEVMKTCAELGVSSASNLIIDFPGSTQAEVDETVAMIDRWAWAYQPLMIAEFSLSVDSAVMRFPESFGVARIRNHDLYAAVLPPEDLARLATFQLSFDLAVPPVSWAPVRARTEAWKRQYRRYALWYLDGGTFMNIHRTRPDDATERIELLGDEAHVYRLCLEIRQRSELHELLANGSADRAAEIDAILAKLVRQDLLFQEGGRFLALAIAPDPTVATRRIRASARPPLRRAPRQLPVLGGP